MHYINILSAHAEREKLTDIIFMWTFCHGSHTHTDSPLYPHKFSLRQTYRLELSLLLFQLKSLRASCSRKNRSFSPFFREKKLETHTAVIYGGSLINPRHNFAFAAVILIPSWLSRARALIHDYY